MLIGVTGFIGKVWLANTLLDLPQVKKIYLLIRRQKSTSAERRLEKLLEESPVFDPLFERYGNRLPDFLRDKIEVIEGDVTQPGLGLAAGVAQDLQKNLDVIVNSSGLTDFNPDLRDEQAQAREHAAKDLQGAALEIQVRKNRVRWLKNYLMEAGIRRARELGWPNTYTLTKSLAESLIVKYGAGLPVAVVRPAIVETSVAKPFVGWNEGINTSASLSYLLGTYFRQLPSKESKRLHIIH